MQQLELIISEGAKADSEGNSVELGIPIRDPVEREGDQFIVLTSRCHSVQQLDDEIRAATQKLHELRTVARANFARWDHEKKNSKGS